MKANVPHFAICAVVAAAVLMAVPARATIVLSTGAGSAVTSADRTANFDSLANLSDLTSYAENNLSVTVPIFDFISFDPTHGNGGFSSGFFYANGNSNPVIVTTTDSQKVSALEFNIGTGYSDATVYGAFEAFDGVTEIANGTFSVSAGGVIGFTDSDLNGFDALYLGAYASPTDAQQALTDNFTGSNDLNAVAIDNLKVQLAAGASCGGAGQLPCGVPEPTSLLLLATAFFGHALVQRRRERGAHKSTSVSER